MDTRSIQRLVADTKATITDEELFGSSSYRSYLQTICDNVSGRYGRNCRVRIDYAPSDESVAYTDNFVVFINTANHLISSLKTRGQRNIGTIGLLGHECGHLLFTDFPALNKCQENIKAGKLYPKMPTKKQLVTVELLNSCDELKEVLEEGNKHKLSILLTLIHSLSNIIEDGYIEGKMKAIFPGTVALGLQLVNTVQYEQTPTIEEMIENGFDAVSIAQNVLLSYCKVRKFKNPEGLKNRFTDVMRQCIPVLNDALLEDDPKERLMSVNLMLLYWWEYIKPLLDKVDEPEESAQNENSSGSRSGSPSNSKGSSDGDPEQNSNSEDDSNGNSQGSNSNGDPEEKSNSEESANGNSQENSNQEKSSNGNSNSNKKASKSSKKTEQEQAATADEIIARLLQEMLESSEGAKNMKSRSVLSSQASSEPEKAAPAGKQQRLQHLETEVEEIMADGDAANDNAEKAINHELDKLLENAAKEKVSDAVENELLDNLKQDVRSLDFGDAHKNVDISINRQRYLYGNERLLYEQAMIELKPISKMLQKSIMNVIKQRQRGFTERGLYMGTRLDHTAYHRQDGQIFTKRNRPNDEISLAVGVLVDMSGSMSGIKINYARAMALVVYDFCRSMNIPVTIYGHDTARTRCVRLFSFAEFDSIDGNDKFRLMNIQAGGCNRDGCAVRFVAEKLCKRSEQKKLFIVVSDGSPNDGSYTGTAAEADLQAIRKEYTRKGITFLAAAIDEDKPSIKRCYGEDAFLDITDLQKFPLTIAKLIARQIV